MRRDADQQMRFDGRRQQCAGERDLLTSPFIGNGRQVRLCNGQ
jgi:hypothetical protein